MQITLSAIKVLKTEFETLILGQEWLELLLSGNFYEFERLLHQKLYVLYDKICESFLNLISKSTEFVENQKLKAAELGLKQLEFRKANIRLRTGTKINYPSLYAKKVPQDYEGNRHVSGVIWQTNLSCSPMYQSINCLFSVLCPSFEVSKGAILNHAHFLMV